jgi:phage tail sheath protein FI
MAEQFLHGVQVLDIDAGPRPIQTVASAIIGIVGTAPNSQPNVQASLATGTVASNNAVTFTAVPAGIAGNSISITLQDPKANNAALAISVSNGKYITAKLATSAGGAITTTAAQLIAAITAHVDAKKLVSAANTGTSTGTGVVAAASFNYLSGGVDEAFPLNTPTLIAGSRIEAARLGTTGTLPQALDSILDQAGAVVILVRVDDAGTDTLTMANVVGGVDATTGQYKGMQAFLSAESKLGYAPRILIAPGFTHQRTSGTANTVVANMIGIAERLRAVIIADGTNTNDADAIAYAGDFGSKRVFLHDPFDAVTDAAGNVVYVPASPRIAGQIAKSDNERGFWWSPSNQEVNGIVGTARAIDFSLGDPTCRANLLNGRNVATTIRQNGFRLWGNRTLSADPKWMFLSVVRTADIINDSLLRAHLWAVDRAITKTYVADVIEGVNAYLRHLQAIGAILGGRCWADPALNTPDQIAQGKIYFDFDFTPPYPAENITFRSHLVQDYIKEVF